MSAALRESPLPHGLSFAFCAIGNPDAFFSQLSREKVGVVGRRAFPDHHFYTQADADDLSRAAAGAGADKFVTTAKDAVKLRGLKFDLPCYVLEVGLSFDEEGALLELVRRAVRRD
jgi:tetraacyldisaccharide 4'-kinase